MPKTAEEIKYDENVKKFLSQKIILAHILVNSVDEFMGMKTQDVIPLIEGVPDISNIKVFPDGSTLVDFVSTGDVISGENTEDSSKDDATIYYDIRFYVFVPSKKERIKLIIDVEAQNNFYPGYDIVTRGIYYCSRMLSSQKETEFTRSNYDDIKKVYSIWICINCPKDIENTITEFFLSQKNIVGKNTRKNRYDLLSVILVGLSNNVVEPCDEYKLHRLLETFFSPKMSKQSKKEILEKEYDIKFSDNKQIERSVNEMCNVSQGLIDIGIDQGIKQGINQGIKQGVNALKEAILKIRNESYSYEMLIEEGYDEEIAKEAIELA